MVTSYITDKFLLEILNNINDKGVFDDDPFKIQFIANLKAQLELSIRDFDAKYLPIEKRKNK